MSDPDFCAQVLHLVKQTLDADPSEEPELLTVPARVLLAAADLLRDLGYPARAEPSLAYSTLTLIQ